MRPRKQLKHSIDILYVLLLFFIFTACALSLVMLGTNVYKKTVYDMNVNYEERTSFSYISNKFRQFSSSDGISLETFDGCDSLVLKETIEGVAYCTYLYQYDGHLKELFTREGSGLHAEDGADIIAMKSFTQKKLTDTLYQFELVSTKGDTTTLYLSSHIDN